MIPTIQIIHQPELQFPLDLNNRTLIDLEIVDMNVDDTFRVGGLEHRWLPGHGGQAVLTTVKCEPDLAAF